MLSGWVPSYFSSKKTELYPHLNLDNVIDLMKNSSAFREEMTPNWILRYCKAHRFSLVLPAKPDDRLKSPETAHEYLLEVMEGLQSFYQALNARRLLEIPNLDPKEKSYLEVLYKNHLMQAVSKRNFLATYLHLKDRINDYKAEASAEDCMEFYKDTVKQDFNWFSTFWTVAELYKAQLLHSFIDLFNSKLSELEKQLSESENLTLSATLKDRIKVINALIADIIWQARASLNEYEEMVHPNTDLLTLNSVILNTTELMMAANPQIVIAQLRASINETDKVNKTKVKPLNTDLVFFGRNINLGTLPNPPEEQRVVMERKPNNP